jgi:hypothetical protein
MMSKSVMSLVLAAGCVLALGAVPAAHAQNYPPPQVVTNGPQANPGDYGDWSARANVIESRHYDNLLETNLAFRHYRERKECGPVSDPQLRGQCMASFQQYEPFMYGSSQGHRYNQGAGY